MKKGHIESDFKDWINAIRLRQYNKDIQPEDFWEDYVNGMKMCTLRYPTFTFSISVIHLLITFVDNDTNPFIDAKETVTWVKTYKSSFLKPYKPREWLGINSGFKCLIPGLFFKSKSESGFDKVEIEKKTLMYLHYFWKVNFQKQLTPWLRNYCLRRVQWFPIRCVLKFVQVQTKVCWLRLFNRRVEFILGFSIPWICCV